MQWKEQLNNAGQSILGDPWTPARAFMGEKEDGPRMCASAYVGVKVAGNLSRGIFFFFFLFLKTKMEKNKNKKVNLRVSVSPPS